MTTATQMTTTQGNGTLSIPVGRSGLVLNSFADMWSLAQCIHKAGMAPKSMNKPEQVLVALQWGAELGVGPMQALTNIAVINGRPAVWGDLVVALVRRSGKCTSITETVTGEGEAMVATCEAKRAGGEVCKRTFSYKEAKAAGLLSKDTYKSYLRRMLQLRARAFCLRDLFADMLVGLPIAEELQDSPEMNGSSITSGDDAPLNNLDDATKLLEADDVADFLHTPTGPTPEELADPDYKAQGSIPF